MTPKIALSLAAVLAVSACATDGEKTTDAAGTPSAVTGLDPTFGNAGVQAVPLAATDGDRLVAVASSSGGTYASGYVTQAGDQSMALVRLDASGVPDKAFGGGDGVATVNLAVGGRTAEIGRSVAVQSDGKVLLAGPFEHNPSAPGAAAEDTDVAVSRFDATGNLDPSYGTGGTARLDLGTGAAISDEDWVGDTMWGITVLPDERVLVVGAKRAEGAGRTDRDLAVVMLDTSGKPDPSFATGGTLTVDVAGGSETPKVAVVQPDGKIVVSGYTRSAGESPVVSPVLVRVLPDGTLDTAFGTNGVSNVQLLPAVSEAYDVALQGDNLVIAGYGRASADEKVDMISARFRSDGSWDRSYGTDGLVRLDIAKEDDRGRGLTVLPDGRILIAGSGKPSATDLQGMLVLLTPDGRFDTAFGTDGHVLVDLGGPTDAFFGVGVSADEKHALVVGWKGMDPVAGDDGVVARIAL
ncbi:MAG: hypothetical protein ACRDKW_07175 [Actinomycetota bacterium]